MAFLLKNIRSDDRLAFGRAEQFLLENPDPGVRARPHDQLRRAIDTGLGVLLERDGRIEAVSLVYPFGSSSEGPLFSEIGTMRVVANGYGLQVFLAKFHLFQIRLEEWTDPPPIVFAVVTPGTASEHNLEANAGMKEWSPPAELHAERQAGGVPFNPKKRVLVASSEGISNAQADLAKWHVSENRFRTPKGNEPLNVDVGWFHADLLTAQL